MAQYANLNRLTALRDQGIAPQGRRSATGPQERSKPTGFVKKSGNVTLAELEFSNGYVVSALQVEGQKAIIKGPEAVLRLLEGIANGHVQECYDAWLKHVDSGLRGVRVSDPVRAEQTGKAHPLPQRATENVQEEASRGEQEETREASRETSRENPREASDEGRVERLEEQVDLMGQQLNEIIQILRQPNK